MRDVITLFEGELTKRSGYTATPDSPRFMGMLKQDLESFYELLLATLENTDSESDSEGKLPSAEAMQHVAPLRGWGSADRARRGRRLSNSSHP
jgi:hypothetical protein